MPVHTPVLALAPTRATFPARATAAVMALTGFAACSPPATDVARPAGEPLPGLTQAQLARFEEGRRYFEKQWTPEEGLGPLYMQAGCGSCHDLPTIGGAGVEMLKEATRWDSAGGCDNLPEEGGPLIQDHATPLLQGAGITREIAPPSATGWVSMEAPALYGLGLLEAIPDEAILSREDPGDTDGDEISGRASRLPDGRLGRIGHKAYRATILELSEGAFRRSLGLTVPKNPDEETLNGASLPPGVDPVEDPEISQEALEAVADFIRFLAPAAQDAPTSEARADTLRRGEEVFQSLGCPACHVPSMRTGPNEVAALDRKEVKLYSDLLLHDLDPERPTICGPTATPYEVRTARLMGLRFRSAYMHDRRAVSVEGAVREHGGEAAAARARYERLTPAARLYLVTWLMTL
jgi:CxxC motif-containing protein (DUF1111 family)